LNVQDAGLKSMFDGFASANGSRRTSDAKKFADACNRSEGGNISNRQVAHALRKLRGNDDIFRHANNFTYLPDVIKSWQEADPDGFYYFETQPCNYEVDPRLRDMPMYRRSIVVGSWMLKFWKHSRKVPCVDGCYAKQDFGGVYLMLTMKNSLGSNMPIACAHVPTENGDNWEWFFNCLHFLFNDFEVLISDRDKGLESLDLAKIVSNSTNNGEDAAQAPKVFPHRNCALHILRNCGVSDRKAQSIDGNAAIAYLARASSKDLYKWALQNLIVENYGQDVADKLDARKELFVDCYLYERFGPFMSFAEISSNSTEQFNSLADHENKGMRRRGVSDAMHEFLILSLEKYDEYRKFMSVEHTHDVRPDITKRTQAQADDDRINLGYTASFVASERDTSVHIFKVYSTHATQSSWMAEVKLYFGPMDNRKWTDRIVCSSCLPMSGTPCRHTCQVLRHLDDIVTNLGDDSLLRMEYRPLQHSYDNPRWYHEEYHLKTALLQCKHASPTPPARLANNQRALLPPPLTRRKGRPRKTRSKGMKDLAFQSSGGTELPNFDAVSRMPPAVSQFPFAERPPTTRKNVCSICGGGGHLSPRCPRKSTAAVVQRNVKSFVGLPPVGEIQRPVIPRVFQLPSDVDTLLFDEDGDTAASNAVDNDDLDNENDADDDALENDDEDDDALDNDDEDDDAAAAAAAPAAAASAVAVEDNDAGAGPEGC